MSDVDRTSRQEQWLRMEAQLIYFKAMFPEIIEASITHSRSGRSPILWAQTKDMTDPKRRGGWRLSDIQGHRHKDQVRGYIIITLSETEMLARMKKRQHV